MTKRLSGPVIALVVFAIVSGGECELSEIGDIPQEPGTIAVWNAGDTEVAVVAILADDVKSYPTLAPGSTAAVKTNVGGAYQVRVVMTPENVQAYRENLNALKQLVQKQIDGSATSAEKARLFTDLAGINAAIRALEQANAAGCSGTIKLKEDQAVSVTASVRWVAQGGAGFWDTNCPSE